MGMDVYGKNPISERGSYFRNNVWWWRPLAEFICETHPEIAEHCEDWHSNSGYGLGATKSLELAKVLQADIDSGLVAEYEKRYNEWRANLPRTDCPHCGATGVRSDEVGVAHGMPNKELKQEIQILTGRTHGWCNGCDGVGTTENFGASYPFSVENVQEFVGFLSECGGFQIC